MRVLCELIQLCMHSCRPVWPLPLLANLSTRAAASVTKIALARSSAEGSHNMLLPNISAFFKNARQMSHNCAHLIVLLRGPLLYVSRQSFLLLSLITDKKRSKSNNTKA